MDAPKLPIHRTATIALGCAIAAFCLACYGSFVAERQIPASPLNQSRPNSGLPAEPTSWAGKEIRRAETRAFGDPIDTAFSKALLDSPGARLVLVCLVYPLPIVLGLLAAYLGGSAMTTIERSAGRFDGNFRAVFAILIGGLAAVIGACMSFSFFFPR